MVIALASSPSEAQLPYHSLLGLRILQHCLMLILTSVKVFTQHEDVQTAHWGQNILHERDTTSWSLMRLLSQTIGLCCRVCLPTKNRADMFRRLLSRGLIRLETSLVHDLCFQTNTLSDHFH